MKRIIVVNIFIFIFFIQGLFAKPVKIRPAEGENPKIPDWVVSAALGEEKAVRKNLNIKDSDAIRIVSVKNTDLQQLEKQADISLFCSFTELGNTQFTMSGNIEKREENLISHSIAFGNDTVKVLIETKIQGNAILQVLHTPSGEFKIKDLPDCQFSLPERGYLWIKLAFYEAFPEFTKTLRKVCGYKLYDTSNNIYEYYAVFAYDKASYDKELDEKMSYDESLFEKIKKELQSDSDFDF